MTNHDLPAGRLPRARIIGLGLVAALAIGGLSATTGAHEFSADTLLVDHPYAPATPPGVSSAAGYFSVTNEGDRDDRLLGGEATFAGGIEMHRTSVENEIARMRELTDGLVIAAGETVVLAPGETHLMFTDLERPLVEGERLEATLRFERAGEVDVVFAIESPGAVDHDEMNHDEMDHDEMDHDEMDHDEMNHGETDSGEM